MDGGRSCVARRWTGGVNDRTILDRIMLRFRPIAPKPATGGSGSGESPPENKSITTKARPKRKYVKNNRNRRCKKSKVERGKDGSDRTVTTQQLLPQICCRKDSPAGVSCGSLDFPAIQKQPIWLNFDNRPENSDLTAVAPPKRVAESWVILECVTDACMDGGGLGATDVERVKNLEADTCPGFISDVGNKVQWINLAYKRMVVAAAAEEDGGSPPETVVRLVAKVELPISYPAFACRVRTQYTWRNEKYSQTVPCDVWKMDFGGFAWRLDVKTALCLGR
ncbi:unnamed protein product [Camellia sinensis]